MKIWFKKNKASPDPVLPATPIDAVLTEKEAEQERIERASLILEFSKEQYDYALDRTRKLEDKALKVFSSISIIVTALIFLIRYIAGLFFGAEHDIYFGFTVLTGVTTLTFISIAWYNVFRAVHLSDIPKLDYGASTDDYVFDNKRDVSIWGLARRYSEATAAIDERHSQKAENVGWAIKFTGFTGLSFILFVVSCLLMAAIQESKMPHKNGNTANAEMALPGYQAHFESAAHTRTPAVKTSMRPERVDAPALQIALESLDSIREHRNAS